MPFDLGITHYDDVPPDAIDDLDTVVGPHGARFGNSLSAWIEVDEGRIVDHGQDGQGSLSSSAVRIGGMRILVEPVEFPRLCPEPEVTDQYVRFSQTAGGRPGLPAPRRVREAPYLKVEGPTVWTTLQLTLHSDGSSDTRLVGGSPFRATGCTIRSGRLSREVGGHRLQELVQHVQRSHVSWGSVDREVPMAVAESRLSDSCRLS